MRRINEIYEFHVRTLSLAIRLSTRRNQVQLHDVYSMTREFQTCCSAQQYEPVSLTKTGILHGPIDVETNCIVPRTGSKTGTFRIRADFYRVNRDLRRTRNATANKTMNLKIDQKTWQIMVSKMSSGEIQKRINNM